LKVAGETDAPLEPFLLPMALANDAAIRDGACIGDPTEGALVVLAEKGGIDVDETRRVYPRIAEVPFDAEYKLMATFHEMEDERGKVVRCFVKGAPDVLLARSTRYLDVDGTTPPMAGNDSKVVAENDRLASEGLRVLAVARRDFDPAGFDPSGSLLELVQDLELLALIGIVDPPRVEAKAAIERCKEAGIRVRMITGDHATTAAAIGGQLGIEGRALTGAEFAAMSDEQLNAEIDSIGVVARVAPEDKVRLVSILKGQDNIVAMTGDGVNDAPALTRADIGVAMGITGTEVTKDAAEMILTDDNFATIVKAVEGGRGLYDNLMKYVRLQMAELAGFILAFLGASIFNIANGTPLLPLQILWINFAVDVPLALGLGFDVPTLGLMQRRPRPPSQPVITRTLGVRLALSGFLVALASLIVVSWGDSRFGLAVGTTMGLTTMSLIHVVLALEWRDPIRTIFNRDTFGNGKLNMLILAALAATYLATSLGALNRLLDTVNLAGDQWRPCLIAAVAFLVAAELEKVIVQRVVKEPV
jgi:Ca2+-transporting ATPase